jgi:predicted nuclease with TOPRIM domain
MKKLDKELLERFQQARRNIFDVKMHLADIALTERNVQIEKDATIQRYKEVQAEQSEVNAEVVKLFGENVRVNAETGEVDDNVNN